MGKPRAGSVWIKNDLPVLGLKNPNAPGAEYLGAPNFDWRALSASAAARLLKKLRGVDSLPALRVIPPTAKPI